MRDSLFKTTTVPELRRYHGSGFPKPFYEAELAHRPIKTGTSYNGALPYIPDGMRMSTLAEELTLYFRVPEKDVIKSELGDIFGRDGNYNSIMTSTGIRIPEGASPIEFEIHDGRMYWPREIIIGDEVVEEALVPETGSVEEFHPFLGIPTHTEPIEGKKHKAHFWFEPDPTSTKTENLDLPLSLTSDPHDMENRCLSICAAFPRHVELTYHMFRPAAGSTDEIVRRIRRRME